MKNSTFVDDSIDLIDLNTITVGEFDRLCHPFIFIAARKTGLNAIDCDAVCNDILIKIFVQHKLATFDSAISSLKSYLYKMARNTALNYIRRDYYQHTVKTKADNSNASKDGKAVSKVRSKRFIYQTDKELEQNSDSTVADTSLERQLQLEENSELLHRALDILRDRLRNSTQVDALVLNALDEKPVAEVARILCMTPQQVSLACHRCKKMLKSIIIGLKQQDS